MRDEKSLFYYGAIYHRLFDPQLAEARQVTVDLVAEGTSVLDIGCGTGLLCVALRAQKHCRAVGLDLSRRMLEFARKSNPFHDVTFVHGDATDLSAFGDRAFDYATMVMIMHELPRPQQVRVLAEALRVASKGIVVDSVAPLPKNVGGMGIRIVEATFGRDHNPNFKAFLAGGGIRGMLGESGLPITVEYSSVFWRRCREVVVISTQPSIACARGERSSPRPRNGLLSERALSPDAARLPREARVEHTQLVAPHVGRRQSGSVRRADGIECSR